MTDETSGFVPPEPPPNPVIFKAPVFIKGRQEFTAEELKPLLEGRVELPNFEPLAVWIVADMATSHYGTMERGYARLPGDDQHKTQSWSRALFLLTHGQFRGPTGEGHVIISRGYQDGEARVLAGKFTVCQHKKVEGFGANHQRGWHPGYCEKCGLNMDVDSGD